MAIIFKNTFKYHLSLSHIACALIITLFLISPTKLNAEEETSTSEIKASWIYTVIEWLDWQDIPKNEKFTICAIGRDKVYMYLKRIALNNKSKKVLKLNVENKSTEDDLKECRILYISESEQEYYMNILEKINNYKNIITISSINGFAKHSGAIEFVIKKKANLIINLKTFRNAHVSIDDELYGWVQTVQ